MCYRGWWCKLDPGLKSAPGFPKFHNLMKRNVLFQLEPGFLSLHPYTVALLVLSGVSLLVFPTIRWFDLEDNAKRWAAALWLVGMRNRLLCLVDTI